VYEIYTLVRGDIMLGIRDIAMITVGAVGALALAKYKEPLLDKMECIKDDAIEIATDKLDNMR
jgi:hypothetical protein